MPVLDKEQAQEALCKSQVAFIETLQTSGQCLTMCSNPPIHVYNEMQFDNVHLLRGITSSEASMPFSYSQKGKDTSTYRSIRYSDGSESKPELIVKSEPKYPSVGQRYLVIVGNPGHIQDLVEADDSAINDLVPSN